MTASASTPASTHATSAPDLSALAGRRIYFGHQSVGGNLVAGVEQLLRERGDTRLRVVETRTPADVNGPAFVHFLAGRNEDPASKNTDFMRMLDERPTKDGAIALLKYCYVDVDERTDIDKLFAGYKQLTAEVSRRHPDVTLVHVTMPLMTDATGPRATLKRLMGGSTRREINLKRNRFNALLRQEFRGSPLFDLATLESTHDDGTRQFAKVGSDTAFSLAPEYTTDGGHLTDAAQKRFASEMLGVLAVAAGASK